MTEAISSHVQKQTLSGKVELFDVDTSMLGGAVYHFTNDVMPDGSSILFGGVTYVAMPIKSSGWSRSSRGQLPRPQITISNVTGFFSSLNLLYDDLVGVTVTRKRTFKWALDGQPDADPSAVLEPVDIFSIARKTQEDNETCTYELAAVMDVEGRSFPARSMIQNFCDHTYRRWNGSAFDYSKATCPFVGTVYRTALGVPTTQANDVCAKTLPECLARFGVSVDLGYSGFPGIDRVRT